MANSAPGGAPRFAGGAAGLVATVPRIASGVAVEVGWLTAHALMYPLGLRPRVARRRAEPDRLTLAQRGLASVDVNAAATPILLVHGIADNHTIFTVLDRALRRRGFQTVSSYDYGLLTRDVRVAAVALGEAIEKAAANAGNERIHVVGHSLGGLIARYFVQRLGGDAQVHTLVTLGTPHAGTRVARAMPVMPLVRQLRPDSSVIRELAEPAPNCRTRFIAFHSDIDHLIVPHHHARLDHPDLQVRNVAVRGVGHLSMPNNGAIAFQIATALRELDPNPLGPDPAPTTID